MTPPLRMHFFFYFTIDNKRAHAFSHVLSWLILKMLRLTQTMGAPVEVVDAMLLPVILPFNLLKAGINSLVTFLVYKTVSRHLIHGEGWGHHTHGQKAQTEQ